jgi:hypothetical protein
MADPGRHSAEHRRHGMVASLNVTDAMPHRTYCQYLVCDISNTVIYAKFLSSN